MKSLLLVMLVLLILSALVLVGCSSPSTTSTMTTTATTTVINTTSATSTATATTTFQVINLKFGSPFPATHFTTTPTERYCATVEKASNGRVKFKYYDAGSLISPPTSYTEIQKGVVDFGLGIASLAPSGFSLFNFWPNLGYGISNASQSRVVGTAIWDQFPEIRAEFSGTQFMILDSPPGNQLISKTPIRTLADFKGKKIRTIPAYNNLVKSLGAEPISLPAADLYQSLQKGIIDAAITGANDFIGLKLSEVAKYYTALNLGNTALPQKVFNKDSWNKLPPDVQQIFIDNFAGWEKDCDTTVDAIPQQGLDYAKTQGVELITFTPADQAAFTAAVDTQMRLLAADLDAKGLPGTKIFEFTRAQVAQATK